MDKKGLFIALTPDGNRRAVDNDFGQYADVYAQGAEIVSDVLRAIAKDERVRIFAAWGLSDDNVRGRAQGELDILNKIFCDYLERLRADLQTPDYKNVRVIHAGDETLLDREVKKRLDLVVTDTKDRQEKIFAVCLAYGGHDEMERAATRKCKRMATMGERITIGNCLDIPWHTKEPFQPLDLYIRTGTDRPYTSAGFKGYWGPRTEEFFEPKLLPMCEPRDILHYINRYEEIRSEQRTGQ